MRDDNGVSEGWGRFEERAARWMGRVVWVVVFVLIILLFVRGAVAVTVDPFWGVLDIAGLVATVALGIIVDRRAASRQKARSSEIDQALVSRRRFDD